MLRTSLPCGPNTGRSGCRARRRKRDRFPWRRSCPGGQARLAGRQLLAFPRSDSRFQPDPAPTDPRNCLSRRARSRLHGQSRASAACVTPGRGTWCATRVRLPTTHRITFRAQATVGYPCPAQDSWNTMIGGRPCHPGFRVATTVRAVALKHGSTTLPAAGAGLARSAQDAETGSGTIMYGELSTRAASSMTTAGTGEQRSPKLRLQLTARHPAVRRGQGPETARHQGRMETG